MATLQMSRIFAAPQAKVFAHLTQTDFLLNWWGPEGTRIRAHALSFAKPGPWSATMIGPQGDAAIVGGEVRQVRPLIWSN
uniref:SRPBCC domain-containing protein n=1 Tax=Yoonia rhodophyticola TaxID=3137370 RepID=A0AAN0MC84_9RHOB